ncbi:ATP-binding protein [Mesorhizobium sp. M8A.F.Ca.ET.173.01.1.1]|nr:ATP-binding protein [Mesorhizobium sp. M8A.F.Ca.ET.173.01.1.1]
MALRITKASEPITVDRLNTVIYGPPGLGKSSLAFTADTPLLLDFDNGSHRAANRKDTVRVNDWSDVAGITAEDLAPFKTVIVDTAGRALDTLTADIIRINPKHGRGGALTLQGYGELKARFTSFLKLLNSFGKDVVLIAHMDEQRNGDDIIERLDVQGGSKGEIYKAADAMGRLVISNGQRQLRFSPTDAAFGKNPGQLEPLNVPDMASPDFDGFLAGVIDRIKSRLNELTEDQREAVAEQQWFRDALPKVADLAGVNELLPRAIGSGTVCKTMLHKRATELGMHFDKAKGEYVERQKEAA